MAPRPARKTTPAPPLATEDVLGALRAVLERRRDPATRAVLARFAGFPPRVARDPEAVARFVRPRWRRLAVLCGRRDAEVRHAAVWALGGSGDPRAVALVIRLLRRQRDRFDHDYAYAAAGDLGLGGLEAFTAIALGGGREEREHAIQCIGVARLRDRAVPALRRIARRHGLTRGLCHAVHNCYAVAALPLVLPGLGDPDPTCRLDALGAVHSCLVDFDRDGGKLPVPAIRVATTLARLFDEPRMRDAEADPWSSLAGWGLECLAILRAPVGRALALRMLAEEPERRSDALDALSRHAVTRTVEAEVAPLLDQGDGELQQRAALVLCHARRQALRRRSNAVLLAAMTTQDRPACRFPILYHAGRDLRVAAAWLRVAERDRSQAGRVRRRVTRAVAEIAMRGGRRGAAWLRRVTARSGGALARALDRAWRAERRR